MVSVLFLYFKTAAQYCSAMPSGAQCSAEVTHRPHCDFNSEPTEKCLNDFMNTYDLKNLIREATCYKNPENPSCIDLMLTNHPRSFQHSRTVETGLSDFHKLTLTVLKMHVKKQAPKIVTYRDFRHFSSQAFHEEIVTKLSIDLNVDDLDNFCKIILNVINKQAPIKKKIHQSKSRTFHE